MFTNVFLDLLSKLELRFQSKALPWLRLREQRVQRGDASQTHHGHERGRLHVVPDGGGRGGLQETVLPLHQERSHTRCSKMAAKNISVVNYIKCH